MGFKFEVNQYGVKTVQNVFCIWSSMLFLLRFSFFIISLSSCVNEIEDNIEKPSESTILFYLGGNNSLSDEVQDKIDALAEAWVSNCRTNVGNDRLLIFREAADGYKPCLLEVVVRSGDCRIDTLAQYGVGTSADTRLLKTVLTDVQILCPSQCFGLILFSYGSGWLPDNTFVAPRSVVTGGGSYMDLPDFAASIPTGMCRYIIFESGLMAGLEVAYELKEKTEYIVASSAEILSPGFTPLYDKILPRLCRVEPQLNSVAQIYYDYRNMLQDDERSATISVIKTSEVLPAKKLLIAAESRVKDWEYVERDKIQHFDRRKKVHLFYDAAAYMGHIGTADEITAFADMLSKAVIYQAATPEFMPGAGGFTISRHCGLTLYIPDARCPYLNKYRKSLGLFAAGIP